MGASGPIKPVAAQPAPQKPVEKKDVQPKAEAAASKPKSDPKDFSVTQQKGKTNDKGETLYVAQHKVHGKQISTTFYAKDESFKDKTKYNLAPTDNGFVVQFGGKEVSASLVEEKGKTITRTGWQTDPKKLHVTNFEREEQPGGTATVKGDGTAAESITVAGKTIQAKDGAFDADEVNKTVVDSKLAEAKTTIAKTEEALNTGKIDGKTLSPGDRQVFENMNVDARRNAMRINENADNLGLAALKVGAPATAVAAGTVALNPTPETQQAVAKDAETKIQQVDKDIEQANNDTTLTPAQKQQKIDDLKGQKDTLVQQQAAKGDQLPQTNDDGVPLWYTGLEVGVTVGASILGGVLGAGGGAVVGGGAGTLVAPGVGTAAGAVAGGTAGSIALSRAFGTSAATIMSFIKENTFEKNKNFAQKAATIGLDAGGAFLTSGVGKLVGTAAEKVGVWGIEKAGSGWGVQTLSRGTQAFGRALQAPASAITANGTNGLGKALTNIGSKTVQHGLVHATTGASEGFLQGYSYNTANNMIMGKRGLQVFDNSLEAGRNGAIIGAVTGGAIGSATNWGAKVGPELGDSLVARSTAHYTDETNHWVADNRRAAQLDYDAAEASQKTNKKGVTPDKNQWAKDYLGIPQGKQKLDDIAGAYASKVHEIGMSPVSADAKAADLQKAEAALREATTPLEAASIMAKHQFSQAVPDGQAMYQQEFRGKKHGIAVAKPEVEIDRFEPVSLKPKNPFNLKTNQSVPEQLDKIASQWKERYNLSPEQAYAMANRQMEQQLGLRRVADIRASQVAAGPNPASPDADGGPNPANPAVEPPTAPPPAWLDDPSKFRLDTSKTMSEIAKEFDDALTAANAATTDGHKIMALSDAAKKQIADAGLDVDAFTAEVGKLQAIKFPTSAPSAAAKSLVDPTKTGAEIEQELVVLIKTLKQKPSVKDEQIEEFVDQVIEPALRKSHLDADEQARIAGQVWNEQLGPRIFRTTGSGQAYPASIGEELAETLGKTKAKLNGLPPKEWSELIAKKLDEFSDADKYPGKIGEFYSQNLKDMVKTVLPNHADSILTKAENIRLTATLPPVTPPVQSATDVTARPAVVNQSESITAHNDLTRNNIVKPDSSIAEIAESVDASFRSGFPDKSSQYLILDDIRTAYGDEAADAIEHELTRLQAGGATSTAVASIPTDDDRVKEAVLQRLFDLGPEAPAATPTPVQLNIASWKDLPVTTPHKPGQPIPTFEPIITSNAGTPGPTAIGNDQLALADSLRNGTLRTDLAPEPRGSVAETTEGFATPAELAHWFDDDDIPTTFNPTQPRRFPWKGFAIGSAFVLPTAFGTGFWAMNQSNHPQPQPSPTQTPTQPEPSPSPSETPESNKQQFNKPLVPQTTP